MSKYWFGSLGLACAMATQSLSATPLTPGQHNLLQGFLLRSCIKRTPLPDASGDHAEAQVQKYCQCASEHLANTFSSEEVMAVLSGQIKKDDPRGKKRLAEASAACAEYLQPDNAE
ncbi:hypothetical protein [uncultured Aquitalea sp.]|uniref:hypothetical protein n=1 Tax=uncultured Aquitalea sp. TaxID=540272 RepID=UPI0025ED6C9E|nr:hypothetical protein [uncultured Aquitalea sp.]